jgi:DNA-binding MurR/RpiR family transcriptional regulator
MGVVDRIVEHSKRLTGAERKVAEVLATDPQTIAFGTVAGVAAKAGTSGPSVVRLAVKLGYGGFVELQSDVQQELARQLGPAYDRIRQRPPTDLMARIHEVELDNVQHTLQAVDELAFQRTVQRLADRRHQVWILPGDMTTPVGETLAGQLSQLRERVELLVGSEVTVGRRIAGLVEGDTLLVIDIRRYERWLVNLVNLAAERGAVVTALTDSPLSPLVAPASEAYFFAARGVGPFDSLTGAISLVNALAAAVAARLRPSATGRLDAIESAWATSSMLVAAPGGYSPLTDTGLSPTNDTGSWSRPAESAAADDGA